MPNYHPCRQVRHSQLNSPSLHSSKRTLWLQSIWKIVLHTGRCWSGRADIRDGCPNTQVTQVAKRPKSNAMFTALNLHGKSPAWISLSKSSSISFTVADPCIFPNKRLNSNLHCGLGTTLMLMGWRSHAFEAFVPTQTCLHLNRFHQHQASVDNRPC